MTPEDRIAALIEQGTPGPWEHHYGTLTVAGSEGEEFVAGPGSWSGDKNGRALIESNTALIVATVNAAPAALAVIRCARGIAQFDLHATQHIDGLQHDGHDLRAIHVEDCAEMIAAIDLLAASLAAWDGAS